MPSSKLSIVILSFNQVEATLACLESLAQQTRKDFNVVVIDNCSAATTVQKIRHNFPTIHLLALDENLGWAGGNNVGIRQCLGESHDWIMLLNNDTVLPKNTVANLFEYISVLQPSIITPAIRYLHQPSQMQVDPSQGIYSFHAAYVGEQPAIYRPDVGLWELDFVYGACMIVHRQVFETVGLMEERFFLQMEETDFYLRAKNRGFKTYCAASICIDHAESLSFGGKVTPTKTYYIARNNLLLAERHVRSFKAFKKAAKEYYYFLAAKSRTAGRADSLSGIISWLVSSDANAQSCRLAIWHYATRQFGKLDPALLTVKN
jgi:GT2 family glycosyltransferase